MTEALLTKASNLYIETTGRHSGQAARAHLWYAYESGQLYLLSVVYGDGRTTHWYRNLREAPECLVEVNGQAFEARATSLEPDAELEARVREMFRAKYGERPYQNWFGRDAMIPVVLEVPHPESPVREAPLGEAGQLR